MFKRIRFFIFFICVFVSCSSQRLYAQIPDSSRGEQIMRALAAAYPDWISRVEYRNRDWAVLLRGSWFYYAQGRLLPEELRDRAGDYDPQPFYTYIESLPPWRDPEPEEAERYRDSASRRRENPPRRSTHFYDALWMAHDRNESYDRVKSMRFLSKSVMVHYSIMDELALVEIRILAEAKSNSTIARWIREISTVSGWNWRNIAQTESRSFHAYGAAVDLLPAQTGGLETYWLWTAERNPQWWAVPYARRMHPPEAVIKIFEDNGFIWGGKWMFYDTMHFEYRPEILLLNNFTIKKY